MWEKGQFSNKQLEVRFEYNDINHLSNLTNPPEYIPSEVVHPGFVGQNEEGVITWDKEKVEELRKKRQIEPYRKFMNFEGISDEETTQLYNILSNLFIHTKEEWEPKRCQVCALSMLDSITDEKVSLPNGYTAAWVYKINHSWLEIYKEGNTEPIIFDPTGLDPDSRMYRRADANMYTPYFGPRVNAPGHLKIEYLYDECITRIFSNDPLFAIETSHSSGLKTIKRVPRENSAASLWERKRLKQMEIKLQRLI